MENHTDFMLVFLNENYHKFKKLIDFKPFILIHAQNSGCSTVLKMKQIFLRQVHRNSTLTEVMWVEGNL
jgi:hypothetical protein